MAVRINTKLVLLLIVFGGFLSVGAGGFFLFLRSQDATKHIVKGQEFMDAGEFRRAKYQYTRAVGKEPANLEYLQLLEKALTSITPETQSESGELVQEYVNLLVHVATHHPQHAEYHLRALEELSMAARRFEDSGTAYWSFVDRAADDMLALLPSTDPAYSEGHYYRAAARFDRTRKGQITERELEEAEEDIRLYLEANPTSDRGWGLLLSHRLDQANDLFGNDQLTRAEEAWVALDEALAEAHIQAPDGPEVLLAELNRLETMYDRDPLQVDRDLVRDRVERLVALAEVSDDPWLILRSTRVLIGLYWMKDVPDPIPMLEAYVARNPTEIRMVFDQARIHFWHNEMEEAAIAARRVLDAEPLTTRIQCVLQFAYKQMAAALLVDVATHRWSAADASEKASRVPAVREMRDQLATLVDNPETNTEMIYANAQVAFVEEDFVTATSLFDRLARDDDKATPQVLMFSAFCLERRGELGLAAKRITRALEAVPANRELLKTQARLLTKMRRYEESLDALQRALIVYAGDEEFLAMVAQVENLMRDPDERMAENPIYQGLKGVQTAVDESDYPTARTRALALLEEHPENLGILAALGQIENMAGNDAEAIGYIDRALAISSDNPRLKALRASLVNRDPIEAAKAYFGSMDKPEVDRNLDLLIQISQLVERRERAIAQAGIDPVVREEAEDMIRRGKAERDRLVALLMRTEEENPRFLEYRLVHSIREKDFEEARVVVAVARRVNADKAKGTAFEARLALAEGRAQDAVVLLQEAADLVPYSGVIWSYLAQAYQQVGNYQEAVVAYDRAYTTNPNNVGTAVAFASLLRTMGRPIRALDIVAQTRELDRKNAGLRRLWLDLEGEVGNNQVVLRERRRLLVDEPENTENAYRLAATLARIEPTANTILGDEGDARYSIDNWKLLPSAEKEAALAAARAEWDAEIDEIIASTRPEEATGPGVIQWYMLQAECRRARNDVLEGQRLLQQCALVHTEDEDRLLGLVALGNYQRRISLQRSAVLSYQAAASIDPQRLEPYFYLAEMLRLSGQHAQAADRYTEVLSRIDGDETSMLAVNFNDFRVGTIVVTRQQLEFHATEESIQANRVEEARERFDRVYGGRADLSFRERLLEASLVNAEADWYFENDRVAEAEAREELFYRILDEAEAMEPTDPTSYAFRAVRQLKAFERTGNDLLLDDALEALGRADKVAIGDRQVAMTRFQVLRARGDHSAAIAELRRVLERNADDAGVRDELVRMLVREERIQAAIAVIDDAIDHYGQNPIVAGWYQRLGGLYMNELDDPKAALVAFTKAWEISPSTERVARVVETLLALEPPDTNSAMSVFRSKALDLNADPMLRGWYARVLNAMGRRDAAIEQLRLAYGMIQGSVDGGGTPTQLRLWFTCAARGLGDDEAAAIEALLMELSNNDPVPIQISGLATVWAQSESGISRALELQREAIAKADQNNVGLQAMLQMELGGHLLRAERPEEAREAYERVLEILPNNSQALNNVAFILADILGRPEDALPYAEKSASLAPRNWNSQDTVGWVHYLLGNYQTAERFLRRSVSLSPESSNRVHLAHVFTKLGRWDLAQRQVEQAAITNDNATSPDPELRAEINQLADDIRNRRGGS